MEQDKILDIRGIALLSPWLKFDENCLNTSAAKFFNYFLPKYPIIGFKGDMPPDYFLNDKENYMGKVPSRTVLTLVDSVQNVSKQAVKVNCPTFLVHGKHDKLSEFDTVKRFFGDLNVLDKVLTDLDG